MRICVVTVVADGVGGMQRHTHDLVRGLVAAGHELEVVCPAGPGIEDGLHGARWHLVPEVRPAADFGGAPWLRDSLAAFRRAHAARPFDVVHAEGSSALALIRAGAVGRRPGPPLVVEFHGNFLGLARAAVQRARRSPLHAPREARHLVQLSRQHFVRGNVAGHRPFHAIVPSHQQVEDTRRSHLLRADRVHVVPNGVDARLWQPAANGTAAAREGRSRPLLAASGRLNREKGFDVAIRALAALARDGVDAELAVVGDGEERGALAALARSEGVERRVRFTGALSGEALVGAVAAADVYLFPTRRDEAAPLVLPEAMACGLPVVASRIGGIPEVIDRPGVNGILVPPGDEAALAATLRRLLPDREGLRSIGARARERVLAEYTLERMVERTLAVYERAIADA